MSYFPKVLKFVPIILVKLWFVNKWFLIQCCEPTEPVSAMHISSQTVVSARSKQMPSRSQKALLNKKITSHRSATLNEKPSYLRTMNNTFIKFIHFRPMVLILDGRIEIPHVYCGI